MNFLDRSGGGAVSIRLHGGILCIFVVFFINNARAQNNDIESLRAELNELRVDYETRIGAIEQRLAIAEQNATASQSDYQQSPTASVAPAPRGSGPGSAFNPAIGVIFQGQVWNYTNNPEDHAVQGFPYGGDR